MSTVSTAPAAQAPAPIPARRSGFAGVMLGEWTKLRSVRSTVWTLIIFVVVSLGLGQLAICVLGVLVITSEYSTGAIRSSLLAVPRRYPVMLAKGLVFAALVIVIGEIVAFLSFFIGKTLVNGHVVTLRGQVAGHAVSVHHTITVSLSQPGVLQAVVGSGLYLTVLGLFALAIGGLIRHTAGAITAVIGMVLVIFPLAGLLPSSWGAHVHAYLPTIAGQLITQDKTTAGQLLSAWQGFGVFCAWTVLLLAAAIFLLQRRDA